MNITKATVAMVPTIVPASQFCIRGSLSVPLTVSASGISDPPMFTVLLMVLVVFQLTDSRPKKTPKNTKLTHVDD